MTPGEMEVADEIARFFREAVEQDSRLSDVLPSLRAATRNGNLKKRELIIRCMAVVSGLCGWPIGFAKAHEALEETMHKFQKDGTPF